MSIIGLKSVEIQNPTPLVLEGENKDSLAVKVWKVVKKVFKKITNFICFPFRYFGSKTWSVPGVIIRAPYLCVKKIFNKQSNPLKQQIFGKGYHYHPTKELTPEELKEHLLHLCSTAFIHKLDSDWISPFGYQVISPKTLQLDPNQLPKNIKIKENCLFDEETGLKMVLITKGNEVIVTFGALGSQYSAMGENDPKSKKLNNKMINSAYCNLLGFKPKIYKKAHRTFKHLRQCPSLQDKHIVVTGACFGGALASYVALKGQIPALCVNSVPLGVGLQNSIGSKALAYADEYVSHINVQGDWMTGPKARGVIDRVVGLFGLKTPGNFGKKFSIPTHYQKTSDKHSYYLGSAMVHLGYPDRAKPADIITL